MKTVYLAAAETRDLPVSPIVIGVGVFVLLAVMMLVVLSYGKGRPHS